MANVYTIKLVDSKSHHGSGMGAFYRAAVLGPIKKEAAVKIPSKDLIWANSPHELQSRIDEKFPKTNITVLGSVFTRNLGYYRDDDAEAHFNFKALGVDPEKPMIIVLDRPYMTSSSTNEEILEMAKRGHILIGGGPDMLRRVKKIEGLMIQSSGYGPECQAHYDLKAWEEDGRHKQKSKDYYNSETLRSCDAKAENAHGLSSEMASSLEQALRRKMLGHHKTDLVKLEVPSYCFKAGVVALKAWKLFELGKRVFGPHFWDDKIPKYSACHHHWNGREYVTISDGTIIKLIKNHQIKKKALYPAKRYKASVKLWELVWMYEPEKLKKLKRGARANEV